LQSAGSKKEEKKKKGKKGEEKVKKPPPQQQQRPWKKPELVDIIIKDVAEMKAEGNGFVPSLVLFQI